MTLTDHLTFGYPDRPILFKDLTLTLPDRGLFLLTGPSGSGKTTLLRLLCGLEKPSEGSVFTSDSEHRVSVAFQEPRLFSHLSTLENVHIAARHKDRAEAASLLASLELGDALDAYPDELSGGMQKRVALARALFYDEGLLLLDEPFSGLDADLRARIAPVICRTAKTRLTLVITHEPDDFIDPDGILSIPDPPDGTVSLLLRSDPAPEFKE